MQRCKAKSKRSGEQCKNYAVKMKTVCRMHGAGGGPKTSNGLLKCKTSSLRHGMYCSHEIEQRKKAHNFIKEFLKFEEKISS